eukprot:Phypoly_transcript_12052.p1 GENE.Phypoly_transcript_12052~~Phypoly_transcript_12052.p1  ORF type:complete len:379 (+),score=63.12 Phypoly_transcript_12052:35-1138(+)
MNSVRAGSRTCQLVAKGILTRPHTYRVSRATCYSTSTATHSSSQSSTPSQPTSSPSSSVPSQSSTPLSTPPITLATSPTNNSTTSTESASSDEWWSPEEKPKPLPIDEHEGAEGKVEKAQKVVNVGGIRPDGRSPKWFKEVRTAKVNGGYTFLLDGRAARTQYEPLVVPSETLATAMAFEWMSQDKFIMPDSLPITRLATMAIDQMPNARERVLNHLMNAFDSDLTCVRIEEDLLATQRKTFGPMLDWFAEKFGSKPKVSVLFGKLKHPPELVRKVREYLSSLDDFHLQCMEILSSATRSVILPLYLVHGCTGIENAIKAARLEEDAQIKACGNIRGTHDVDRTEVSTRIAVGSLFWRLLELDRKMT